MSGGYDSPYVQGGKKTFISFKIVPFKRFEGSVQMVSKFDSTVWRQRDSRLILGQNCSLHKDPASPPFFIALEFKLNLSL